MSNDDPELMARFIEYLRYRADGRANAIPARDLRYLLHLGPSGDRVLRYLAHEANEQGILVCADNSGYFIPTSPADVEETIRRLHSQGEKMIRRARRLEALAARFFADPPAAQAPLL